MSRDEQTAALARHMAAHPDDFPVDQRAPEPFSLAHLLRLFTRAPKAFWRFDVDFSLDAAVRMAEFAETAGVKGTFYVMATGSFYNPFSLPGQRALESIAAHGHRIGMHVDERASLRGPAGAVRLASDLFQGDLTGTVEDGIVSWHMPSADVLWQDFTPFGSAYAPEWRGHYVSDSRREWDDDKESRLTANQGEGTQCCLHPEHWFGA